MKQPETAIILVFLFMPEAELWEKNCVVECNYSFSKMSQGLGRVSILHSPSERIHVSALKSSTEFRIPQNLPDVLPWTLVCAATTRIALCLRRILHFFT